MFSNMEYVYEVYKEQSFSKAASNLFISQPSLSATIKKVESRIGYPLFDRSTNPIQLTDCGVEYIKYAEKIMETQNCFARYLGDLLELKSGNLVLGASSFFASYILPPIIARFAKLYPDVVIRMVEADTHKLSKLLISGELDLVLDSYSYSDAAMVVKHHFCSETLILACVAAFIQGSGLEKYQLSSEDIYNDKHLIPSVPAVPFDMLQDYPFIYLKDGNDTRSRADNICDEKGFHPNIFLEVDQLATSFHIVCQGMGIAFVSDTFAKKAMDPNVIYFKIDSPHAKRDNFFYYKQNKYVSRPMKEFLYIASP